MTKLYMMTAACAIASLLGAAPLGAQALEPAAAIRRSAAQQIPIGATVSLKMRNGQPFKAVLFAVDEEGVTVKPATRIPVASMRIPFERMDAIERDEGNLHIGRYVGIGAAAGGVVLFLLLRGFN